MPTAPQIAPSLLAADFARMGEEVNAMAEAGADRFHVDVMDGHYVPPITFGAQMVAAIRPLTDRPLDVHLMVAPAQLHIPSIAAAGADTIIIHPEADHHPHRTLQQIRDLGKAAGLALNPGTPVSALEPFAALIDMVIVMAVNPGYGGQPFIESCLQKVTDVRSFADGIAARGGQTIHVCVDGGVSADTAPRIRAAGATILAAGTAAFKGGPSAYGDNLRRLQAA